MRYKRYRKKIKMTFKRWQKYSWSDQEVILSKYRIILLNHRTTMEKLGSIFKRSNEGKRKERRDKIKKTIRKIIKGVNQFSKEMSNLTLDERQTNRQANRLTQGLNKASGINPSNRYEGLISSNSKYNALTNRNTTNYKALTG